MDRIKIFILSIFLMNIFGGFFMHMRSNRYKIYIPDEEPLEVKAELLRSTIFVSEDNLDYNNKNMATLMIKVKNNSLWNLTGLRFAIPSIGFDTLETPSTLRFTHLPEKESEHVFNLPILKSESEVSGAIHIYSSRKGMYNFKARVDTNEFVSNTSNTVSLVVK